MINFGRGRHIVEAMLICMCAGDEDVLSKIRMRHVILKTEKHITELPKFYFFAFKAVLFWIEYEILNALLLTFSPLIVIAVFPAPAHPPPLCPAFGAKLITKMRISRPKIR